MGWKEKLAQSEKARVRASDLRAEGFTYQQIGDELGISRQRAMQLVQEQDRQTPGRFCQACLATGRPIHVYSQPNGEKQYLCVKCGGVPKQ